MSTATMTSKGQLTLPKEVRKRLGLKPGDKLTCRVTSDDEIVMTRKTLDVSELVGVLHVPGKRATIDEMNEAIRDAAVARTRRGRRP